MKSEHLSREVAHTLSHKRHSQMITPRQAASRLGVSVSLIYQLCRQAALRHYRIGGIGKRGRIAIDEADLQSYQAACCKEASQAPATLRHLKLS